MFLVESRSLENANALLIFNADNITFVQPLFISLPLPQRPGRYWIHHFIKFELSFLSITFSQQLLGECRTFLEQYNFFWL